MSRHGDFMIGPGGVGKVPKSEARELSRALELLESLRVEIQRDNMMQAQSLLSRAEIILNRLCRQVESGYHRNPSVSRTEPFRVIDVLGQAVHTVAYKHKNGKLYEHDFDGSDAQVLAVIRNGKRELLITSTDGSPLWDEF
jgi:hypothetical protein